MILDLSMLHLGKIIYVIFFSSVFTYGTISYQDQNSLKELFKSKFKIGVALNKNQIRQKKQEENELIKKEFSSLTAENIMKWEEIHPKKDKYNFKISDLLVKLSEENNQDLIGHTLVWHNQIPDWVTRKGDGTLVSDNTLYRNIFDHISSVAGRYSGKIKGWDVVNEAILDDGSYRENDFYKISADEYIFKSFEIAHKIDPNAELYYNDFSMYKPEKCDAAIRIANKILERGLRIDGIGLQAHWGLDYPSIDEIETSILKIHEAGFRVHFTELDIDVLPNLWEIEGADLSDNFLEGPGKNNSYAQKLIYLQFYHLLLNQILQLF